MPRKSNPNRMPVDQAARKLGMGKASLMAELQRDAKRPPPERKYRFADPVLNENTGRWLYNINRQKLENELNPQSFISDDQLPVLAKLIANELHALHKAG